MAPEPPPELEPVEPVEPVEPPDPLPPEVPPALALPAAPLPDPAAEPPPEPPPFDDEPAASSAAVSAASSAATVLMSPASVVWAMVAALNASVQVSVAGGGEADAVLDGVDAGADAAPGVTGAVHTDVAVASAAPAAVESASSCFWSATSVAWSWTTDVLPPLDVPPPDVGGDPPGPEVTTLVNVADVRVDAVWLASSLARVASAEARLASSAMTVFCNGVGSRDATVSPTVTCCPTVTSTALTVPPTPKVRFAWFTGVTVPTELNEETAVPVLTVAVRYWVPLGRVSCQAITPAATTTTTTTTRNGEIGVRVRRAGAAGGAVPTT